MKKYIFTVLALVVIVSISLFSYNKSNKHIVSNEAEYKLEAEGLSFNYPDGLEGFYLEEQDISTLNEQQLVRSIVLTPTDDYNANKENIGGESSPSWRLAVYNNTRKQSPNNWVDSNSSISNIKLAMGELKDVVVAGANAVQYKIDGLYPTDMMVITSGGYVFVASSSYLDETSLTYKYFESWVNSFKFIPTIAEQKPQGKIDIKVACESALVYMSFSSGEEADKFVIECVEGKHPDVIERYISDMNLNGAVL